MGFGDNPLDERLIEIEERLVEKQKRAALDKSKTSSKPKQPSKNIVAVHILDTDADNNPRHDLDLK